MCNCVHRLGGKIPVTDTGRVFYATRVQSNGSQSCLVVYPRGLLLVVVLLVTGNLRRRKRVKEATRRRERLEIAGQREAAAQQQRWAAVPPSRPKSEEMASLFDRLAQANGQVKTETQTSASSAAAGDSRHHSPSGGKDSANGGGVLTKTTKPGDLVNYAKKNSRCRCEHLSSYVTAIITDSLHTPLSSTLTQHPL